MRIALISAASAALLLAGCSPPAQQSDATPERPAVVACNNLVPDASRQVRVEEAAATAAAASDLRGGAITPGVYDLTRAERIGAATGWTGTRAVALMVVENDQGVTFNWAGAEAGGATDTWTASFSETPQPHLTYTCGRMGGVGAEFETGANALELRLPDGANGQLALSFQRRS